MSTIHAELAIVGSGSGNSLLTPFWDDREVVIAEHGVFGGTCLNVGCIPTKMFVRPAALARSPHEAARLGVTMQTERVDWPAIRDRVFGRIDAVSQGGREYRDVQQQNVTLVSQRVRMVGDRALEAADGTRIVAEQLVLAAGSRPVFPPVPGVDLPGVHTSDTIMRIDELPRRMVILGGGFVACEFAAIFSAFGVEVTQVSRNAPLLRHVDREISLRYTETAASQWNVELETPLRGIRQDGSDLVVSVGAGASARELTADLVLVATGRVPNSDLIGAREAGVDVHVDGRVSVDEYQRVLRDGAPLPGVWALGDICAPEQLKHVANHEARVVAHNLEHPHDLRKSRHTAVPSAVFSSPEVAIVGLTEAAAIERFGTQQVTTATQQYGDTAYGWAMEDETGLCKVIAHRETGEILGAHIVGEQASIILQPIVGAMAAGIDAHTAARGQYWPHPALSEVTENALLALDVPVRDDAPL